MNKFEIIAPCHFGLESVLKREIYDIGYDITKVEDGKVTFLGDEEAVARANIFLRTAERILIKVGEAKVETFDELFEAVKSMEWERYIPKDGNFPVTKASSVRSKLFSPSDIQSIVKKAVVERLKENYNINWFEESGNTYPIRVFIMKDVVTLTLDTTGESLHKRGYRTMTVKAPISETLASALIMLTPWKKDRFLVDPFCGSGTFPIEAALMATNTAPGMYRKFRAMSWENIIDKTWWKDSVEEAHDLIDRNIETDIQGYDISDEAVKAARANAMRAGVDDLIHFQRKDVKELSHPKKYGFIITNPPYGERLSDREEIEKIYGAFGERIKMLDTWSSYIITSYDKAESALGLKAAKNRKIYNGMIKTYFYQFPGPKPPKKTEDKTKDK